MPISPRTYGALEIKIRESLLARTVVLPIQRFIHIQGVSSLLLLAAAIAALAWANSPWHDSYHHVWEMELTLSKLRLPVHEWINDALMAIFFLLVGMEIEHEIKHGALADIRRAVPPLFTAIGGMLVPALLFALLNKGQAGEHGWAIPMATDIAFSLGVLSMVKGISPNLKIFLLSLAIADDIGAIAVIALFYSGSLDRKALFAALVLLAIIVGIQKFGVTQPIIYFLLGIGVWVAILRSGIHATIAGVILGFMVPTTRALSMSDFQEIASDMVDRLRTAVADGNEKTAKHLLGAFEELIQGTESTADLAWGIILGLVAGKPLGIVAFSWIAVRCRIAHLPSHVAWRHILAVGMLAGIGFTVSIFISSHAFEDSPQLSNAKAAVLFASLVAGVLGYFTLGFRTKSDILIETSVE